MAIVSAEVESSGWVLRLVVSGASAGEFADYTLDPDGAPRVVLRSSHVGFVQSGGQAVAGTMARAIPATIPLRLPVNPAAPTPAVIDEMDLGGGQLRVRLALANHVYATDTQLTLDVLAEWRTGEDAAIGLAVTNNSTLAAPLPVMRWADLQFQVVQGVFRVSLIVASHHPMEFQPVAGVKFTATDGVTSRTVWTTALATDMRFGDDLRCYTVEIDPGGGVPLSTGLCRVDAEVYPWLGTMRSTDPAGTRTMVGLRTDCRGTSAQLPLAVFLDPAGERYSSQWVYVDPVNGTTTAAATMVRANLTAAKEVAPSSRARSVSTALQALYLANRTLPAANGQGGPTSRSCDGACIVLAPGVSVIAGTTVTSGLVSYEAPVRIIGDPDDPDPRAHCILRSGASQPVAMRASRYQFENCTLEIGESTLLNGAALILVKSVTVRGKAGFETSSSGLTGNALTAGTWSISCLDTRWWRTGLGMNSPQLRFLLVRGCQFSRTARAAVLLKNRWVQPDDGFVGAGTPVGTFDIGSDVGGCEDNFIAYNDLRQVQTRAVLFTLPGGAAASTNYASQRRHVLLGNVLELVSPTGSQPFMSIGESQAVTASYNIVENNSFIGERVNIWYNDPNSGSNSVNSELFCNRMANNAFDRNATKHDDFMDGTFGYRPWLTGGWAAQCGVMHEGNWDGGRAAGNINTFRYWFRGLRSTQTNVVTPPGVVNDCSVFGNNNGGGDYRPVAGSPLLGRMLNSNTDRDLDGMMRGPGSAAGAFEAQAEGEMLAPVPARHAVSSEAVGLVTSLGLTPANARHGHLAGQAALLAGAGLAPPANMLPGRSSTSSLLLSVPVMPGPARHLLSSAGPQLASGGLLLAAGTAGHGLLDEGALLIVPATTQGARLLRVGPDLRRAQVRQG